MLNKIEFSDLYKFTTSTGLVIMALSIIVPWLFLKQDPGLSISETEYICLNADVRELIDSKIENNLFISKKLHWIALAFFMIGSVTMYLGIRKWIPKQKKLDQYQDLDLAEKISKQKNLGKGEVSLKLDQEITEERASNNNISDLTLEKRSALKSNLSNLEQLIYEKLVDLNPQPYKISNNIKFENKYPIDILLSSLDTGRCDDILIEVKYLQQGLNFRFIETSFKVFKLIFSKYTNSTKRKARIVFLFVYRNDISSQDKVNNFKEKYNDFIKENKNPLISFILLNDLDIEDFDPEQLLG